ncbi:YiiX/YebB-like N1pC/P60 family cysteine hydrolase [Marinobacterium stanieri]|uniref:YiiX/YebB-like N1pC/P60 family cysteine hydrolase n=1 Tax=Marinobacterium stanieri TaxID=49186 RepID=UPI000C1EB652|nr:YiiX/YebB-like N1pC/P60 family cysteine hydrolase [Marinobacterium stanieri]
MYIIPISELEKGDILLTSENSATSKVVRKSTGSNFSHAILYVGSGSYIHSDSNGVHSGNLQRLLFDAPENVTVLRVKCDQKTINQACIFARLKIGTTYSVRSAVNAKLKASKKENENRQFCSRLVAQAYEYAGVKLVDNAYFCTPQEILESQSIQEVLGKARKATDEEIDFADSENPIENQSYITNEILSKVRKLTKKDIQTLEQITQYVIENPVHDQKISKIYKDSGYLTMWEYDTKKNAWRYDGRVFINLPLPIDELIEMARFEKDSAQERLALYKGNLEQYFYMNEIYKLEYSSMHFDLYKKLVENTLDNINAAEYVLENT